MAQGKTGLGFNIVGGADQKTGVFVSRVLEGGLAAKDGRLQKGDVILEVNGFSFKDLSHEQSAAVLKATSGRVEMKVRYCPNELAQFERRIEESLKLTQAANKYAPGKPFTVRCLFDYDASGEKTPLPDFVGLSFKRGEVLYVTTTTDKDWWLAERESHSDQRGYIPSRSRIERKMKNRVKKVNFEEENEEGVFASKKQSGTRSSMRLMTRSLFQRKRNQAAAAAAASPGKGDSAAAEEEDRSVVSYEAVRKQRSDRAFARPVVILGPSKDLVCERLLTDAPHLFTTCVPHTTRPKRDDEDNGREYFFISREQMEEDIRNGMCV
jgi:hypothetical protein